MLRTIAGPLSQLVIAACLVGLSAAPAIAQDVHPDEFAEMLMEWDFDEEDWQGWDGEDPDFAEELAWTCCFLWFNVFGADWDPDKMMQVLEEIQFDQGLAWFVIEYCEENEGGGGPNPSLVVTPQLGGAFAVLPGTSNVVVSAQSFEANVLDYTINELRYSMTGTGVLAFDIVAARIIEDVDEDGELDGGEPELDADKTFTTDGAIVSFDPGALGGSFLVPAGVTRHVLLVVDFAATVLDDRTFTARYRGAIANGNTLNGNQPGPTVTIDSNAVSTLTVTPANPLDTVVQADTTVVIGGLLLEGSGTASSVDTLQVQTTGDLIEPVDLLTAAIYLDVNRDGAVNGLGQAGGDVLLDESLAFADNATIGFVFADPLVVPAGGSVGLLFAWTIGDTAPAGALFGGRVVSIGASATTVAAELPIDLATFTIAAPTEGPGDGDSESGGSTTSGDFAGFDDLLIGGAGAGCATASGDAALLILLLAMLGTATAVRTRRA